MVSMIGFTLAMIVFLPQDKVAPAKGEPAAVVRPGYRVFEVEVPKGSAPQTYLKVGGYVDVLDFGDQNVEVHAVRVVAIRGPKDAPTGLTVEASGIQAKVLRMMQKEKVILTIRQASPPGWGQ
jgi:hypothetical protein